MRLKNFCTANFSFLFFFFESLLFDRDHVIDFSSIGASPASRPTFQVFFLPVSSGIDNNPTVFYRLMPGSTAQTNKHHTFYLQQRPENGFTWADIKVNHPLDYETIKEYNLTIRVEVGGRRCRAFD